MDTTQVIAPKTLAEQILARSALTTHKPELVDVPGYLNQWMAASGGLAGRRVLDVGCGAGLIAAGIAFSYGPRLIHGVDQALPESLPHVLRELGLGIPPQLERSCRSSLADLPDTIFDVVYSWSMLQHLQLSALVEVIDAIYNVTAIGGRVLVQVQDLYYSADSGQLCQYGLPSWSHLTFSRLELRERLFRTLGENSDTALAALSRVDNKPRLSSGVLMSMFIDAGFHLVRRYATAFDAEPPSTLREVFHDEVLTEDQVILLFSKN